MSLAIIVCAMVAACTVFAKAPPQQAENCKTCHGLTGKSPNAQWPNLAGQNKAYLVIQLKAFRDGKRENPAMTPYVADLTDEDIETLAEYYASRQRDIEADGDAELVETGRQLSASCTACHGQDGKPVANEWPIIAGQYAAYLEQQLKAYKKGERIHPAMQAAIANFDEKDFAALAAYYSQLEP
ncbi:MAG: cytochrome c [Pseudomonadales bacterium]